LGENPKLGNKRDRSPAILTTRLTANLAILADYPPQGIRGSSSNRLQTTTPYIYNTIEL
jgi:hypothetical protein